MKNNFKTFLFSFLFFTSVNAEMVNIQSQIISVDKKKQVSIFQNEVIITTKE